MKKSPARRKAFLRDEDDGGLIPKSRDHSKADDSDSNSSHSESPSSTRSTKKPVISFASARENVSKLSGEYEYEYEGALKTTSGTHDDSPSLRHSNSDRGSASAKLIRVKGKKDKKYPSVSLPPASLSPASLSPVSPPLASSARGSKSASKRELESTKKDKGRSLDSPLAPTRRSGTTDTRNQFLLHDVVIDEGKRFDAYREMSLSATSVHPAIIKDSAGDIPAVAKGQFHHHAVIQGL